MGIWQAQDLLISVKRELVVDSAHSEPSRSEERDTRRLFHANRRVQSREKDSDEQSLKTFGCR